MMQTPETTPGTTASLQQAIALMRRLRGPGGCPWDREQTLDSLKPHTLEETYEVFDAIDRRAWPDLKDELGDLLLQVLFYAQLADEAGYFSIEDVAAHLNAKLIRRHPHIFGDVVATSAAEVKVNWDAIKQQERSAGTSDKTLLLDSVPHHVPAMMEATKLGARAAKVGFDWLDSHGLLDKVEEECRELRAELHESPLTSHETLTDRSFEELGDLLFTVVNLARHLHCDPESALKAANAKFRKRFNALESSSGGQDALRTLSADQLNRMWQLVKAQQLQGSVTELEVESKAECESRPDNSSL